MKMMLVMFWMFLFGMVGVALMPAQLGDIRQKLIRDLIERVDEEIDDSSPTSLGQMGALNGEPLALEIWRRIRRSLDAGDLGAASDLARRSSSRADLYESTRETLAEFAEVSQIGEDAFRPNGGGVAGLMRSVVGNPSIPGELREELAARGIDQAMLQQALARLESNPALMAQVEAALAQRGLSGQLPPSLNIGDHVSAALASQHVNHPGNPTPAGISMQGGMTGKDANNYAAYKDEATGVTHLAVSNTDSLKDLTGATTIIAGGAPEAMTVGDGWFQQQVVATEGSVIATGHSQGGAIASAHAANHNIPSVTFGGLTPNTNMVKDIDSFDSANHVNFEGSRDPVPHLPVGIADTVISTGVQLSPVGQTISRVPVLGQAASSVVSDFVGNQIAESTGFDGDPVEITRVPVEGHPGFHGIAGYVEVAQNESSHDTIPTVIDSSQQPVAPAPASSHQPSPLAVVHDVVVDRYPEGTATQWHEAIVQSTGVTTRDAAVTQSSGRIEALAGIRHPANADVITAPSGEVLDISGLAPGSLARDTSGNLFRIPARD